MNNPIQMLESSNLFSSDAPGVANTGQRKDGESSFSSILSQSKGEPSGTKDGQSLPASGNKLPEQHADDGSSVVAEPTDASAGSNVNGEPSPVDIELPEVLVEQTVPQQSLVPDVLAVEEAVLAEQPLNVADSAAAEAEGQQLQLQLQSQVVDIRFLAKMTPDNLSLPIDQLQQGMVDDVAESAGLHASYMKAAESGRVSSDAVSVANVVREAVQFAMAGQSSGGNLKQFMQQNWNNQTVNNLLPAANSMDANAVPFLQTLSDSVLTTPVARVQVPVGQPGWGEAVSQQVTWFVSQKISAASLRLNPQHLGPMEMAVSMDGDQASISFTSQHSMVRDALESAIPRLREMLSENGLNLADVNVSQQGKSHGDDQGSPDSQQGAGVTNANDEATELVSGQEVRRITVSTQVLIDYYA